MKLYTEQEWLEEMQNNNFEMPPLAGPSLGQKLFEGIMIYIGVALLFRLIDVI